MRCNSWEVSGPSAAGNAIGAGSEDERISSSWSAEVRKVSFFKIETPWDHAKKGAARPWQNEPCCTRRMCTSELGYGNPIGSLDEIRFWSKYEFRVPELSHLRKVEAGDFGFDGNALSKDDVENPVQDKAEGKHKADECCDANDLRYQLAGVSVQQAGYGARNAVPRATIVPGAAGQQTTGEHGPHAAG